MEALHLICVNIWKFRSLILWVPAISLGTPFFFPSTPFMPTEILTWLFGGGIDSGTEGPCPSTVVGTDSCVINQVAPQPCDFYWCFIPCSFYSAWRFFFLSIIPVPNLGDKNQNHLNLAWNGLLIHSIVLDSFKCFFFFPSAEKGRNTLKFQKYVYCAKIKYSYPSASHACCSFQCDCRKKTTEILDLAWTKEWQEENHHFIKKETSSEKWTL